MTIIVNKENQFREEYKIYVISLIDLLVLFFPLKLEDETVTSWVQLVIRVIIFVP